MTQTTPGQPADSAADDYARQIQFDARPEKVFDALTTTAGFASWWAPATGSAVEGGELRVSFLGIEEPLVLHVEEAKRPSTVIWKVEACDFLPDWAGTRQAFTLSESGTGGCDLQFCHEGLRPQLECYDMCSAGWNQYLPSLRDYIETGTGNPFRPGRRTQ